MNILYIHILYIMIKINYVFSIGHRCNCVNFVKKNNLRKISGPFNNMFIDL